MAKIVILDQHGEGICPGFCVFRRTEKTVLPVPNHVAVGCSIRIDAHSTEARNIEILDPGACLVERCWQERCKPDIETDRPAPLKIIRPGQRWTDLDARQIAINLAHIAPADYLEIRIFVAIMDGSDDGV